LKSAKNRNLRIPPWRARLPPIGIKQVVVRLLPYVLIAWMGNKLAWLYHYCPGDNPLSRMMLLMSNVRLALGSPALSLRPYDLLIGVVAAAVFRLAAAYRAVNSKKFRHGREYGSARWSA